MDVATHYRAMLGAAQERGERTIVVGNSLGCVAALHLRDVADEVVLTALRLILGGGISRCKKLNASSLSGRCFHEMQRL